MTYYPLNPDFTVRPADVVANDFAALVLQYPHKPIYLMELGYPGGALCNSSLQKQSAFITAAFNAWDDYRDEIKMINLTWLHDLSSDGIQTLANYYEIDHPNFVEYLATLGLRTYAGSGADKPAFTTLQTEAAARGW